MVNTLAENESQRRVCIRYVNHVHCTGDVAVEGLGDDDATAAYCLQLPGKVLYLSPLLATKKFRKRGNKDGALKVSARD